MHPKQLSRNTVYESNWINLHLDKIELPSGKIIDKYHVIEYVRDFVVILLTNDQQEVLLIKTFRIPTNKAGWELPMGGIEKGESTLEAARREAQEETGYEVSNLKQVFTFYPSNGMSTEKAFVVFGEVAAQEQGKVDENEVMDTKWVKMEDVKSMIMNNEIQDASTTLAFFLFLESG